MVFNLLPHNIVMFNTARGTTLSISSRTCCKRSAGTSSSKILLAPKSSRKSRNRLNIELSTNCLVTSLLKIFAHLFDNKKRQGAKYPASDDQPQQFTDPFPTPSWNLKRQLMVQVSNGILRSAKMALSI